MLVINYLSHKGNSFLIILNNYYFILEIAHLFFGFPNFFKKEKKTSIKKKIKLFKKRLNLIPLKF